MAWIESKYERVYLNGKKVHDELYRSPDTPGTIINPANAYFQFLLSSCGRIRDENRVVLAFLESCKKTRELINFEFRIGDDVLHSSYRRVEDIKIIDVEEGANSSECWVTLSGDLSGKTQHKELPHLICKK